MKKKKVLLLFTLFIYISNYIFIPVYAYAKENQYNTNNVYTSEEYTQLKKQFNNSSLPQKTKAPYWNITNTKLDYILIPFYFFYKLCVFLGNLTGIIKSSESKKLAPQLTKKSLNKIIRKPISKTPDIKIPLVVIPKPPEKKINKKGLKPNKNMVLPKIYHADFPGEQRILEATQKLIQKKIFPKNKISLFEDLLKHKDKDISLECFNQLLSYNLPEKEIITYCTSILPYVKRPVQIAIVKFFAKCKEKAEIAIPFLITQLENYCLDNTYRTEIIKTFATMKNLAKKPFDVPGMTFLNFDVSSGKYKEEILYSTKKTIAEALTENLTFFPEPDLYLAFHTLLQFDYLSEYLMLSLGSFLISSNSGEKIFSIKSLREIPKNKYNIIEFKNDLLDNLNHENKNIRLETLYTLAHINDKEPTIDRALLHHIEKETSPFLKLVAIESFIKTAKRDEREIDKIISKHLMPFINYSQNQNEQVILKALHVLVLKNSLYSALPHIKELEKTKQTTTNKNISNALTETITVLKSNQHLRTKKIELEKIVYPCSKNPFIRNLLINFLLSETHPLKNKQEPQLALFMILALTQAVFANSETYLETYYKDFLKDDREEWISKITEQSSKQATLPCFFSTISNLLSNPDLSNEYKHKLLIFFTSTLEKQNLYIKSRYQDETFFSFTVPFNCYLNNANSTDEFLKTLEKLAQVDSKYKEYLKHYQLTKAKMSSFVASIIDKHKPILIKRSIFSNYMVYDKYFNEKELFNTILYTQGYKHKKLIKCIKIINQKSKNMAYCAFTNYALELISKLAN